MMVNKTESNSRPTGYDAYRYYGAIRKHFTTTYNASKYKFLAKSGNFSNLPDYARRRYERMAEVFKHKDSLRRYIAVCMFKMNNPHVDVIYEVGNSPQKKYWKQYTSYMMTIEQKIVPDVDTIVDLCLKSPLTVVNTLMANNNDTLSYSAAFMLRLGGWGHYMDKKLGEDHLIWEGLQTRLNNISPFLTLPEKERYPIVKEILDNHMRPLYTHKPS